MGIGLSVSRTIIESHNGRLWAERNRGPGATFSFSIPEYFGEGLREVGYGQCAEFSGDSMKVVQPLVSVVDDDESVRESLPDLLRAFGFNAKAFSSAEEFLTSDNSADRPRYARGILVGGVIAAAVGNDLVLAHSHDPLKTA